MIGLPLLSLGILLISLVGVVLSFQYYLYCLGLRGLKRNEILTQRHRTQRALGYLLVSGLVAAISLVGVIYPAASGAALPAEPLIWFGNAAKETATLTPDPQLPGTPTEWPTLTASPEPTLTPTPNLPKARIGNTGGAGVNVRTDPGFGTTVITLLNDGDRVGLYDELQQVDNLNWQAVRLEDGQKGWVVQQYLIPEN
jgi:hypothetical protein